MSEHIDPLALDLLYGADLADTAPAFALLERPDSTEAASWLIADEVSESSAEQYEQQLAEARTRFASTIAHALAAGKLVKDGKVSKLQPFEATDDSGQTHSVSLLQLSTSSASRPYTLYKLFTNRVTTDETVGTRTEHTREFWFVSGSQYRHIPNGLERKREYTIVRPKEGEQGELTYIADETPELTQLNYLTRLTQQAPALQARKQGFGQTILGFALRKKPNN